MADLIERDALVSLWKPLADRDCFASNVIASCLNELNAQPTIDAVPVVHGHWFITEYEYFDCSVCGDSYYTGADSRAQARSYLNNGYFYRYCPNCGAKMDEGVEHEAN